MFDKFEGPESKENLSEKQKEILEGVGVETITEVEDILGGIEEQLKSAAEDSDQRQELIDQRTYFSQVLADLHEAGPNG